MTTTHYAQCEGAGKRLCNSCRRHVENNPQPRHPAQAMVGAQHNGERCGWWMPQPVGKPALVDED